VAACLGVGCGVWRLGGVRVGCAAALGVGLWLCLSLSTQHTRDSPECESGVAGRATLESVECQRAARAAPAPRPPVPRAPRARSAGGLRGAAWGPWPLHWGAFADTSLPGSPQSTHYVDLRTMLTSIRVLHSLPEMGLK
jgi:hypothetical protein